MTYTMIEGEKGEEKTIILRLVCECGKEHDIPIKIKGADGGNAIQAALDDQVKSGGGGYLSVGRRTFASAAPGGVSRMDSPITLLSGDSSFEVAGSGRGAGGKMNGDGER